MNQSGRFDALRAQLRRAERQAQTPAGQWLQRLRDRLRQRPVRTYGSRLRRP